MLWNGFALAADDPAIAAARKRQEAIKSFDIEFKRTEVIPKGWFTKEPKGALPGPRPETDTTLESVNRVVVDGKKYRFEDNHPIQGILEFVSSKFVCCFDGSVEKGWFHHGVPNQSVATGWIKAGTRQGILSGNAIAPVWLSANGPYPDILSFRIVDMRPVAEAQTPQGGKNAEYEITQGHRRIRFWLDPMKDYAIRRIEDEVDGTLKERWIIQNREFERLGWLPESWVYTHYASGQETRSSNVQITKTRLNEHLAAELFDLQFPEGTHVYDARNRKDYRANADGSLREISLLDEFVSEPKPERRPSWFARNRWLNLSIAMALLIVLFYIRFRRRPAKRMKALPFD